MTVEEETARGLAYLHASDKLHLSHDEAYEWAKQNWLNFMDELETPDGRMLLGMARTRRKIEEGQED